MSVQHSCPFRGYPEFYETAREFPAFAARCDEAFGWVADVAMRYVYRNFPQRVMLGADVSGPGDVSALCAVTLPPWTWEPAVFARGGAVEGGMFIVGEHGI